MRVTRKGSIRNRQLNRQRILEHNHTVRGTAFSSASWPVCRWGSSHLTKYAYSVTLRHSTNKPPRSDAPTTVQTGKRCTASRVARQRATRHQVGQEQCLGRRARVSQSKTPTECTVDEVLSVLCNAVVVREATHACCWRSPQRDNIPHYRPSAKLLPQTAVVFIFQNPPTNRHQLLQPVNLSLHCPHSLCNAVDRQHLPRKPRRGTGRLAILGHCHLLTVVCSVFVQLVQITQLA